MLWLVEGCPIVSETFLGVGGFTGVEGFKGVGGFERVGGFVSVGKSKIFKNFSFCPGILHNSRIGTRTLVLTNQLPKSKLKSLDLLASFGIVTLGVF